MPKILSEEKMKLLSAFSWEEVLNHVQSVFEIGEKAAGNPEEFKAAKFVENQFKKVGLENVQLEPFPIIRRNYRVNQLKILEPFRREVPCANAGTSLSTPLEGISGEVVDAGFGTLKDYERLKNNELETEGKIALVERNDNLTYWHDMVCHLANDFGIKAVVFASLVSERTAFRKDAFPFPSIPTVCVTYEGAQYLRNALEKGKVKVNLKNIIQMDANSTSYNVTGELIGSEYPDERITLSAHHDSWFGGANDDALGVATIIEIAKILKKKYKPKRTIKFISFGAEESGSKDFMEWCVGSFAYVGQHRDEIKNTVVNINFDSFAYGDSVKVRVTPEMATCVESLIKELGFQTVVEVINLPTTWTDHWSFVMSGVSSIDLSALGVAAWEKIYHTNFDTPINISHNLLKCGGKFALALTLLIDSEDILPYNFPTTIGILKEHLSHRLNKTKGIVNLSKALREATKLEILAQEFDELKNKGSRRKRAKKDAALINRSQLEMRSSLNKCVLGTGGEANKEAAWVIAEHLDTLVNLKAAIQALYANNLESALESLESLRTMKWGLNFNLKVYNKIFNLMSKFARYPGIYPNLMAETLSLREKLGSKRIDVSKELSSIEKKYSTTADMVSHKISELEAAIAESSQKLTKIICRQS